MQLEKLEGYNSIYAVDVVRKEYKKLFGKNSKEYADCLQKLRVNLKILDVNGIQKALQYQQFEKLDNEELYSIRYVSKSNPRVLFAVFDGESFILLSCCKEKNRGDYEIAKETARARMKQLEE
ncbi:MAG: hypothetical protein Q4F31_05405 [Eubacteriales bacterium]|nr:hypothetical protein [Eubacteriales bacterium]